MEASLAQSIFYLLIIGFIAAIGLRLLKSVVGCLILGVATVLVLAVLSLIFHVFGLA